MPEAPTARGIAAVLLVAALAAGPLAARAQVYKCAQANGTIAYQSVPCPTNDKPPARPTVAQLNAQRAAAPRNEPPGSDPYANAVGSRPHAGGFEAPPSGDAAPAQPARRPSDLVAEVQARNRRENEQRAWEEAHKNDKVVNMAACNGARHDLGVLNEQRPVFSYDNKGNRVFVEDKDRADQIALRQRTIAATCP